MSDPVPERTPYQQRVIRDYYRRGGDIALQRLGEILSDLYLAEGKARARLWNRVSAALEKLKVPKNQVEHIVGSDNPMLLADLLKRLLKQK